MRKVSEKVYSVNIDGRRIDFTEEMLQTIKDKKVESDDIRKTVVHLFTKKRRIDIKKNISPIPISKPPADRGVIREILASRKTLSRKLAKVRGRVVQRFNIGDKIEFYDAKQGAWDKGTVVTKRVADRYDVRVEDNSRRLISGTNMRPQ